MPQTHYSDRSLRPATSDHDRSLELVDTITRKDGTVACVEERVVLEETDGMGGDSQGRGGLCLFL